MIINVDYDGVIHDFYEASRHGFWYIHGGEEPIAKEELTEDCWCFWEQWGVDKATFWGTIDRLVVSKQGASMVFGDWANVIDGAVDGINALKDAGHELHLVTAKQWSGHRYLNVSHAIQEFLYDVRILDCFTSFNFVRSGDKLRYRCDLAIDDNPDVASWNPGEGILVAQPWNIGAPFQNLRMTWKEIADYLA